MKFAGSIIDLDLIRFIRHCEQNFACRKGLEVERRCTQTSDQSLQKYIQSFHFKLLSLGSKPRLLLPDNVLDISGLF